MSSRSPTRLPLTVLLWLALALYMASLSQEIWSVIRVWFEIFNQSLPQGSAKAIKASREAAWAAWTASTPGGLQPLAIQFAVVMLGWSVLITMAGYWLSARVSTLALQVKARMHRQHRSLRPGESL